MTSIITFIGRLFDEGTIIAVAKKFQEKMDCYLKHTKLNKKMFCGFGVKRKILELRSR
jgi:hypothetical protein